VNCLPAVSRMMRKEHMTGLLNILPGWLLQVGYNRQDSGKNKFPGLNFIFNCLFRMLYFSMSGNHSLKRYESKFAIAIALFILISRLPLVHWGMPAFYISTEYFISKQVFFMAGKHSILPQEAVYPTLYYLFLVVIYGIVYTAGHLLGFSPSPEIFAGQFLLNPAIVIVISRSASVFLTILFILRFHTLVKWLRIEHPGFLADGLVAFFPGLFMYTFLQLPEILMLVLVLYAITYHFRFYDEKSLKYLLLSALFAGLSISTKYTAGFIVFPILFSVLFVVKKSRRLTYLLLACGFILIGFGLGTPGWFIQPAYFLKGVFALIRQSVSMENPGSSIRGIGLVIELLKTNGIAGLIWLISLAYLIFSGKMNAFMRIWAYAYVLPTFLLVSFFRKYSQDYIFPIYPIVFLAFIMWVSELLEKISFKRKFLYGVWVILGINWIFYSFKFYNGDTRQILWNWLEKNHSTVHSIVYDHYHFDLPVIDLDRYVNRGKSAGHLPDKTKQFLLTHTPENRLFKIVPLLQTDSLAMTSLSQENSYAKEILSMKALSPDELKQNQLDIIILNGEEVDVFWNQFKQNPKNRSRLLNHLSSERAKIYSVLFQHQPLLKINESYWKTGPAFWIYRVEDLQ
jgi:hypothetical protein